MSEREQLSQVITHLTESTHRVYRQLKLIDALRASGRDTTVAESLLQNLQISLRHHQEHLRRLQRGDRLTRHGHRPNRASNPAREIHTA